MIYLRNTAASLVIALLIFSAAACFQSRKQKLIEEGNRVVAQIDAFRKQRGKLPDSLQEIGIEEKLEGPLFYEKIGDNEYILWFGTELGESVTYNSKTHKWQ